MKLYDFEKALETGRHCRAAWGGGLLVSKGIVDREVYVDAETWELSLVVKADDGFRWVSEPWSVYADARVIDPLHHAPATIQLLACALGLIAGDFASALRDAAPRLVASMRDESGDYPPAKTEAEAVRNYNAACTTFDRQVLAWEAPLCQQEVDVEEIKARHRASVVAMVEQAMGVRREG